MSFILCWLILLEWLLALIVFCIGTITIYFAINSGFMRNAPPVPTSGKVKRAMLKNVAQILTKRKSQTIMDLGSGWGTLLLPLAQQFPNHNFIGIEHGWVPYLVSKFRARKMKNIKFIIKISLTQMYPKRILYFYFYYHT